MSSYDNVSQPGSDVRVEPSSKQHEPSSKRSEPTNEELVKHISSQMRKNDKDTGTMDAPRKCKFDDEANKDITITIKEMETEMEEPSILTSPVDRMRYEWAHSRNGATFCGRMFCSLIIGMSRYTFVNSFPILSIAELVVGFVYLDDCPADSRIPVYLVVAGFFGTVLPLIPICYKHLPQSVQGTIQSRIHIFHRMEAILQCFLLIWFILGCIWVYSAYKPNYVHKWAGNYCFRGMYLFIFWLFTITFIIIFFIIILICVLSFLVIREGEKEQRCMEQ